MKLKMSLGAQLVGKNIVSYADFKGISRIRTGLKLVNAFEVNLPKDLNGLKEDDLKKAVTVDVDLDCMKTLKDVIEEAQGIKGMNAKLIVELYDSIEAAEKAADKS